MYSYQEVFDNTLKYFDGDELATKIWIDKYSLKDNEDNLLEKTPECMHRRIASELARIEKHKFKKPLTIGEIFSYLDHFKYIIPQGSALYGIGNNYKTVSISNCFLAESPQDCYNSILDTDKQLVNISKRRGGVGIDLSNLRPKGTPTKNSAKSSTGIVSWMKRYSHSIREVGQNSRRGALILTLSIHHPDILDFCTIKNNDTEVTGANISVKLTNEFLKALDNNEEYELRFPIDSINPTIRRKIKAKDVWNTIIHSAWLKAEPGLLMWDNVLKGPADCYEEYRSVSVNPCQPSWAKVLTKNGIRALKDVNIGDEIWSETGWTKITNKSSNGIKKVFKYVTSIGCFYGTKNHKIISNNKKIEVKDAESIDILSGEFTTNIIIDPQDVMDGLLIGDGMVHKASKNLILLCIGKNDKDYFKSEIHNLIGKNRSFSFRYGYEVKTTLLSNELPYTYNRIIPDRFLYGNKAKVAGFLRGLFSANGSICRQRVTLKASSLKLIEQVQMMLSSIGIKSYITTNKPSLVKFKNGEYLCKKSYDINITSDRNKFHLLIGFIQKYKTELLLHLINNTKNGNNKTTYEIKEIEFVSEEEVFNITVDNETHTYWTQGCNVANCSEITLSELDSCRLLCINLFNFVDKPFTKSAKFNFELLYKCSGIAQRLMDDIVDLESEKIDQIIKKIDEDPESEEIKQSEREMWLKIKKNNDEGRRTGTGTTALGDVFAALNIRYGSVESIKLADKIYKTIKLACYESSVEMAEELGPFKCWNPEKEKNNEFLLRIKDEKPELYEKMNKVGRRNISLLTNAPTGSMSILTQTTSGIEPLFEKSYVRRRKINSEDKNCKVDFIDKSGDKWQNFNVYHPKLKMWMEINNTDKIENNPWICANEIDWIKRVELQSTIQKHICHSISSTVNIPENSTEEIVDKIYRTAFEKGCKGITVYRDKCRSGVLVKEENKERPKELLCDVHHVTVNGVKYAVLVGLQNNTPYEVFAFKNGTIDNNIKTGRIIKKKKNFYKAIFENEEEISPITMCMSEEQEIISRLTSGLLRTGADMHFIIKQLEKVGEKRDMHCFAVSIARSLKKYIVDGTKEGELCLCGSELVRIEGCKTCMNCGYSACS